MNYTKSVEKWDVFEFSAEGNHRRCPMCQAVPKEMWMDARREDVLDAPYFHLVLLFLIF